MNTLQEQDYQRVLLLEFDEDEHRPLKPAVAKAMEASGIQEVETASKLNRKMVKAGYYENERRARNFHSILTQSGVEHLEHLLELKANPPAPKVKKDRSPAIEITEVELPASGLHLNHRLDKSTWSRIMRQVTKLNYQTAFIPAGVEVFIRNPETNEMTKVETIA